MLSKYKNTILIVLILGIIIAFCNRKPEPKTVLLEKYEEIKKQYEDLTNIYNELVEASKIPNTVGYVEREEFNKIMEELVECRLNNLQKVEEPVINTKPTIIVKKAEESDCSELDIFYTTVIDSFQTQNTRLKTKLEESQATIANLEVNSYLKSLTKISQGAIIKDSITIHYKATHVGELLKLEAEVDILETSKPAKKLEKIRNNLLTVEGGFVFGKLETRPLAGLHYTKLNNRITWGIGAAASWSDKSYIVPQLSATFGIRF